MLYPVTCEVQRSRLEAGICQNCLENAVSPHSKEPDVYVCQCCERRYRVEAASSSVSDDGMTCSGDGVR